MIALLLAAALDLERLTLRSLPGLTDEEREIAKLERLLQGP